MQRLLCLLLVLAHANLVRGARMNQAQMQERKSSTTRWFQKFAGKNCFEDNGLVGAALDEEPSTGHTAETCQNACKLEDDCNCVVFEAASGNCWRREFCCPLEAYCDDWCMDQDGFDAYLVQPPRCPLQGHDDAIVDARFKEEPLAEGGKLHGRELVEAMKIAAAKKIVDVCRAPLEEGGEVMCEGTCDVCCKERMLDCPGPMDHDDDGNCINEETGEIVCNHGCSSCCSPTM